jgi:hypothetical protein
MKELHTFFLHPGTASPLNPVDVHEGLPSFMEKGGSHCMVGVARW